jgi:hypothetical protein
MSAVLSTERSEFIIVRMQMNKTEKSFSNLAASQFCFSRSNKSTTTLQFCFLQGCVIVALQGCVIVALQGCIIVALRGCVIVALQGCIARLHDCCAARLRHCCFARLRDCCVARLRYSCVTMLRYCCDLCCTMLILKISAPKVEQLW